MDSIKLINPVDKFYSFKKFKYLSIKDSDITAQGAIKIDQKKILHDHCVGEKYHRSYKLGKFNKIMKI